MKSQQVIVLKIMDIFDRAIISLACSSEPPASRLLAAWIEVSQIITDPEYSRLPSSLRKNVENMEACLKTSGGYEDTISGMSPDQVERLIKQLLNIYAESISDARKWTKEIESGVLPR